MRALVDAERIQRFARALGQSARGQARVYLTGGATAVLTGWRESTLDIDIKIVPDADDVLRAIPMLKESLNLNVELASPDQFVPVAPGWEDRSPFVVQEGPLAFHHFDLVAQALAKIERGHDRDLGDVDAMLDRGLVTPSALRETFERVRPWFYRYPAISPGRFQAALDTVLASRRGDS